VALPKRLDDLHGREQPSLDLREVAARLSFIDEGASRILRIDYAGTAPDEHIHYMNVVGAVVTRQRGPLFLMTLASDRFTGASSAAIKRYVERIAPFESEVDALAWLRQLASERAA
jgi:hypothetical protein